MPAHRNPDPPIKVSVFMPASLFLRLREHADRTGRNMSQLCREGALRELEAAELATAAGT